MKQTISTTVIVMISCFILNCTNRLVYPVFSEEIYDPDKTPAAIPGKSNGYLFCDFRIESFNPYNQLPKGNYSLALKMNNVFRKFGVINGIASTGEITFDFYDKLTFEFSGSYADDGSSIRLYHIRRTDGLYLTGEAGVSYRPRSKVFRETQQWIIHHVGSNGYNLIRYKPGTCFNWASVIEIQGSYVFTIRHPGEATAAQTIFLTAEPAIDIR